MTTSWSLSGTYFESCNCEAACPCVFLSEPTEDECTVLVGWHVEEGQSDGVSLDGLNVALALRSPGHMAQVPWTVALYLDERADGKQSDALTRIFTGQEGGHPLCIAPGHEAVVARSEQLSYHDHGLEWELSEKNGSPTRTGRVAATAVVAARPRSARSCRATCSSGSVSACSQRSCN